MTETIAFMQEELLGIGTAAPNTKSRINDHTEDYLFTGSRRLITILQMTDIFSERFPH
jgi:hypothetical protein